MNCFHKDSSRPIPLPPLSTTFSRLPYPHAAFLQFPPRFSPTTEIAGVIPGNLQQHVPCCSCTHTRSISQHLLYLLSQNWSKCNSFNWCLSHVSIRACAGQGRTTSCFSASSIKITLSFVSKGSKYFPCAHSEKSTPSSTAVFPRFFQFHQLSSSWCLNSASFLPHHLWMFWSTCTSMPINSLCKLCIDVFSFPPEWLFVQHDCRNISPIVSHRAFFCLERLYWLLFFREMSWSRLQL